MIEKRKILLVENQKFQFDKVVDFDCLECFDLFPNKNNYIVFIDNVRVWVNREYLSDYRNKALSYIKDFIINNNIEFIIMDHILGGAYHSLTGIDLAEEINCDKNMDNCMPVLFLSKTEQSEKKRMKKYENYKKKFQEDKCTKWIHKGYFGDEILNEDYFEKIVIPEIHKLFAVSEENKFWIKFDLVKFLYYPENQEEKKSELFRIRDNLNYCNLPNNLKENIESVYSSKDINGLNLKTLKDAK